jgi:CheY-like chemotaxis protein
VLRGRRVVVADDDPAVVWFLSGVLKSAGALVREAHDGARALELVFSEWPDLVISDVLMPKLDGFSLCREIKRDVAVRDVPVILLSWKEDLLQRLRELGADADAYLEKEVPAPSLMRRLEEVMRPRARVEARLGAGREVSGRLDGLTPRLILELTSALQSDARVSIRDAAYSYTVQIRGGRPRSVIRTAADGTIERGDRVLTGLLGASAGRFTVTPDTSPCAAEFEGTLGQLLAEPIARVRRVQKQLSSPSLSCVVGVQIDEASIARYRASTPEPIEGLLGRLIQGASPRDLLLSGAVQPRLLETVLMDVARHGAVIGVQTIKPSEVDREAPVEAPQKPSTKLSAVTPPIASPLPSGDQPVNTQSVEIKESAFGFEMPSRPPEVKARTAQENDWSGLMDGVEVEPQKPERPVSPESAEPPSDGWDVGEPATIPGVGKAAAPSPAQPKAEQTVAAPEKDIQTKEPAPPKPPPAPTRPAPSPAAPPRPATRTPSPARPQAVHLAQGVLGLEEPLGTVNATPSPPARKARPEPVPPKPPPLVNAGQKISSVPLSPITATLIDARVGPVEAPRAAPPAAPNPPTRSKAPPSPAQPPSAQPKTSPPPAQAAAPPAPPAPSESPLAVETEGSPKTKASLERMPTVLQTEPATELESSPATPVVSVDRTDAVGLASPRRRHSSPWALLLWASAAAVASFGVVRLVVLPAVIRSGQPAAERQSPEHTASAPDPAPSNQVASAPRQEKLPVPPDVDLPAGLGLLEIVSDGKLGIFVDGGFVGAGSLKRLYLAPGSHEVKVRSESAERSSSAMVEVGLRTRLTFEPGEPALAR